VTTAASVASSSSAATSARVVTAELRPMPGRRGWPRRARVKRELDVRTLVREVSQEEAYAMVAAMWAGR
jgi:hypothetical protein